jgi:hypothetical protein
MLLSANAHHGGLRTIGLPIGSGSLWAVRYPPQGIPLPHRELFEPAGSSWHSFLLHPSAPIKLTLYQYLIFYTTYRRASQLGMNVVGGIATGSGPRIVQPHQGAVALPWVVARGHRTSQDPALTFHEKSRKVWIHLRPYAFRPPQLGA